MLKISSLFKYILSFTICAALITASVLPCAAMTNPGGIKIYCDNESGNGEESSEDDIVLDLLKSAYNTDEIYQRDVDDDLREAFISDEQYAARYGKDVELSQYLIPIYDDSGNMISFLCIVGTYSSDENEGYKYFDGQVVSRSGFDEYNDISTKITIQADENKVQWRKDGNTSGLLQTSEGSSILNPSAGNSTSFFVEYGYKNPKTGKSGGTVIFTPTDNFLDSAKCYMTFEYKDGTVISGAQGVESYYGGSERLIYKDNKGWQYVKNGDSPIVSKAIIAMALLGTDAVGTPKFRGPQIFSKPSEDGSQAYVNGVDYLPGMIGVPTQSDYEVVTQYLTALITNAKVKVFDAKGDEKEVNKAYLPSDEELEEYSQTYLGKPYKEFIESAGSIDSVYATAIIDSYTQYQMSLSRRNVGKIIKGNKEHFLTSRGYYDKRWQLFRIDELQ